MFVMQSLALSFRMSKTKSLILTVAEDHPDSILESNVLSDEFFCQLARVALSPSIVRQRLSVSFVAESSRMDECCPCFF